MATYNDILPTETDPDAPLRSSLFKRMVANPIALAEGATGAPVNQAAWHPYDMVNVGDGATGLLYDFAVSGAQASVTANFSDGYDYMIRLVGISHNNGAGAGLFVAGVSLSGTIANSVLVTGTLEILAPTLTNYPKWAMVNLRGVAGSTAPVAFNTAVGMPYIGAFNFSAFASALSSVAISWSSGNFDAGQVYLYRRRNFMFG